jgi:NADP-dependent 3-hydroxy acid dehydrogenase YdfG
VFSGKTYWLIGASEGLGRALARALHAEGAQLVLSARNAERLQALADDLPGSRAIAIDVTDAGSVAGAWGDVGEVDGVIYCAGAYDPVSARDWQPDAVLKMVDVNFVGALRVLGHVVPALLVQNAGHIVLIGSLSGHTGLPGAIGYSSSKAALMHLAENMHLDLHETGVRVQSINPGFIRTRLTDKNTYKMPMIQAPEDAAQRVIRAMRSHKHSVSFPAPFSWLFRVLRVLPIGVTRWLLVRN